MKLILIFCLQLLLLPAFSQEKTGLLQTESNWGKEFFSFPLGFAPEITYHGTEEAAFSPNWAKKDSADFWTYAFLWNIDLTKKLTVRELEQKLQLYFDGLMQAVNSDTTAKVPMTKARFRSQKTNNTTAAFNGEIHIFDAFTTKKALTLYVSVEQYFCPEKKKSLVLFRLSPQVFDHNVWRKLGDIRISDGFCDYNKP